MAAQGDIDVETLQAQIDMSMSFAHNLVTSWIKPTQMGQLRSNGTNATQILEEELRRPPRLGVGAPIPAISSEAREASKLKHRLVKSGKKDESLGETKKQALLNSDDEEHKGRPTKRKTKVDPFALEGSKKSRKSNSIFASLSAEAGQQRPVECTSPKDGVVFSKDEIPEEHSRHSQNYPLHATQHYNDRILAREMKQRKDQELLGCPRQGSTSPRPATLPPRVQSPLSPSPTLGSPSSSSRKPSRTFGHSYLLPSPQPLLFSCPWKVPVPANMETPLHFNKPSSRAPDEAKVFRFPLLNLDGPPEPSDKREDDRNPNNSRKKRRRRKKHKAQTSTGTGDN
ncbi:hypothetical protein PAXRUDRAFT_8482 [Paxillus rubicundulus Ve08.2h10]|uniref:Uncharacterized protein n=1 Tax=Paxillus rubicundulus Ve08.2h10 TaxID=930991 RepID=A0A0D0DX49_9AGAM|nr:hypothetical protein PAXRUDRAFT_8482 [Paxillus rubicundulus Ve08.2h10]